jgi:hypothetical protein
VHPAKKKKKKGGWVILQVGVNNSSDRFYIMWKRQVLSLSNILSKAARRIYVPQLPLQVNANNV